MIKGIVMERSAKHIIVMTQDGQFVKLARQRHSCQIGEEILFPTPKVSNRKWYAWSGLAVGLFFAIILFSGMGSLLMDGKGLVVAYVTVDINPSIEFGINADGNVVEAKGLNQAGSDLLEYVEYQGKSLIEVSEMLINQADQRNYLQPYLLNREGSIVITSTVMNENKEINVDAIVQQTKDHVTKVLETKHPQETKHFVIESLPTPKELREEAIQQGISTGKLAIELLSKETDQPISLEQLQELSIHEAAKQIGGIGKLIGGQDKDTKEHLKQLLKQQKDNQKQKVKSNRSNRGSSKSDPTKQPLDDNVNKGQEPSKNKGKDKNNHKDNSKNKDSDKDKNKDKNKGNGKDKNKGENKDNEKSEDRGKNKAKDKSKSNDNRKSEDRAKDKEKDKGKNKDKGNEKGSGNGKGKGQDIGNGKDRNKGGNNGRSHWNNERK